VHAVRRGDAHHRLHHRQPHRARHPRPPRCADRATHRSAGPRPAAVGPARRYQDKDAKQPIAAGTRHAIRPTSSSHLVLRG
jgi:hypothetical protein